MVALGDEFALAEVHRETFDIGVSDMQMPGMDGAA
jgi:CheY-like chemotaxis protein